MTRRRTTLFRKVFSRLFIAGALPLFGITVIGATLLYFSYRESAEEFEKALLAEKRTQTDRFVRETVDTFEIILSYDEVAPPVVEDQEFLLEGLLKTFSELDDVSFLQILSETPGQETARIVRGHGAPLRFLGTDGAFLVAKEGKTHIGGVQWVAGEPTTVIASPVRNRSGVIVSVLRGELRLTKLQELFQGSGFSERGSVFLVEETGKILAHSEGEAYIGRETEKASFVEISFRSEVSDNGLSGERSLLSALPVTLTRWTAVAEWPVRDAFAPLIALFTRILFIGLLLLGAIIVLANVQAKEVVKPIRALQIVAVRIGRGEFVKAVRAGTRDELEDLADALNRMRDDLVRLQEIRAAEVRARALAQAFEKEQELSEAKDTLLTTASHQFRTPISVLNWNIGLLKQMALTKDAQELISGIAEHADNLAMIASDLLNATAFGAGYVAEPSSKPFDARRLLEESAARYRPKAMAKRLRVSTDSPKETIPMRGSYGALRIMLENLLANAVTYTPDGGEVSLSIQATAEAIRFTVRDTGIGIPEAEQKHLFSSFFRASNAITARNVGTGLGLFIARNIAVGHGGVIDASSKAGEGAAFTVALPRRLSPEDGTGNDSRRV